MSEPKHYTYVDAHYEHPTRKTRMRWIRIPLHEVAKRIIEPSRRANCFTSVQRFKDSVSPRDRARREETRNKKGNGHDQEEEARRAREREADELPNQQTHYHGIYFDFDCDYKKLDISLEDALERSRLDAVKVTTFFLERFDLNPAHVQSWFSGSKGFHVMIHPEAIGIQPHFHLSYIVKHIAIELKDKLVLPTLDTSVYTIPRMWRIPNTIHPSTGRFKIELTNQELAHDDIGKILQLTRGPRVNYSGDEVTSYLYDPAEYREIKPDEPIQAWWRQFVELYDIQHDMKRLRPRRPIVQPRGDDDAWPECVVDMMGNGPKEGGPNRNRVLLPIAGFFKDAGVDKEEAHRLISDWTEANYPEPMLIRERQQNGRTVVEAAYRGLLRFSCRAIRGNRGIGTEGRVSCPGEVHCPWIGDPSDQEPEEIPTVHLSEATKGCYMNTVVRTPIHVAAIAGHPFDLPMKGKVLCNPDVEAKLCNSCPGMQAEGKIEWSLDAGNQLVLQMINVNETQRKGAIKRLCGIPQKCFKHRIEITDHSNVEELQAIPMVDFSQVYIEKGDDQDLTQKSARHVVRRCFHLGHGIVANKKYMMEGSVFAHPKDQRVCFLSDKFEAAQNDIDQFEMSPELYDRLIAFQKGPDQSVAEKLNEIHRDFLVNVHKIGGRFDLSMAIDLCYHSVIGFKFAGDIINKGWFELLIMGDTATGKFLANSAKLLTSKGWIRNGDVEVGDKLIGRDGKPTRVKSVHPQGKQPVYRVTFRDGGSVLAGGPHLWTVGNINWERDGYPWKVRTTDQLRKEGLHWAPVRGQPGRSKFWIPTVEPVEFVLPRNPPPLEPWVLGVLLGDEGMTSSTPNLTNPEPDIAERVANSLPPGCVSRKMKLSKPCPTYSISGLSRIMRELGLAGHRAETKFVPKRYLWGTVKERLELLQGLCDTDGSVDHSGRMIDYSTASEQLANDIVFLVQSLGGLVSRNGQVPIYEYKGEKLEGQYSYRLGIHMSPELVPVTTKKHLALWEGKDQRYLRTIESIELEGEEKCTCIQVDADDELYVADEFVVTHNTTMTERMMQHFGLGELIGGEDSKRTGLVYASIQIQGQWVLRWGKIAQSDRRLLIIDEFGAIPGEEVAKMTQLRSEGRARGGGVNADYETFARTRLILLTNPRNNRGKLAGFNYGIQAVQDLFDENQDTRRVDLAIIAEKGEVAGEVVKTRWDKVNYPHRYTADLCRNLVLWAWSREPHQVEWQAGAEDEVMLWSNRLGQTYECDIPLAEEADLRLKIARIAAAVAARLFSTDSEAKKVIITSEHVQFAAKFMDSAYRETSMAYFEYARRYKADNNFTKQRKATIKEKLSSFEEYAKIIDTMLDVDLVSKPTLTDMVNLEKEELNRLWKFMVGGRLIRRVARGYRKSPAFTEYLRELSAKEKARTKEEESRGRESSFKTGGAFEYEVIRTKPTSDPLDMTTGDDAPVFDDDEPFEVDDDDASPF